MADIDPSLHQLSLQLNDDIDEGFHQGDSPDKCVPYDYDGRAFVMLKAHAESTSIFYKKQVPTLVQNFFKTVPPEKAEDELPQVMETLAVLNDDSMLRATLMEEIPSLAAAAVMSTTRVSAFKNVVGDYLIPLVVKNLDSNEKKIRQTAHEALLQLVEKGYVNKQQVEIQLCPRVLAALKASIHQDGVNTDMITLIGKLALLLGADVTERVFLETYRNICDTQSVYVKMACAVRAAHFAAVIRQKAFETILLPCFLELCSSNENYVRESCADVMVFISCVSSPEVRKTKLAPAFANFLEDDNVCVRTRAFRSLGLFITTFSEHHKLQTKFSNYGDINLEASDGNEVWWSNCVTITPELDRLRGLCHPMEDMFSLTSYQVSPEGSNFFYDYQNNDEEQDDDRPLCLEDTKEDEEKKELNKKVFDAKLEELKVNSSSECQTNDGLTDEELSMYNSYNYWYISPVLDESDLKAFESREERKKNCSSGDSVGGNFINQLQDLYLEDLKAWIEESEKNPMDLYKESKKLENYNTTEDNVQSIGNKSNNTRQASISCSNPPELEEKTANTDTKPMSKDEDQNKTVCLEDTMSLERSSCDVTYVISETNEPEPNDRLLLAQSIVPEDLLKHFISMTDYNSSKYPDKELIIHCAYSLPAVALTLGKENWPLLKPTVEKLANSIQLKVRVTVACSLHELADILGPETTANDLTPLFDNFLKDSAAVRVALLNNFAAFLKCVNPKKRNGFMPQLKEFLFSEEVWNWRVREELARQLLMSIPLFKYKDVISFLVIADVLLVDKVAAVREMAIKLLAEVVKRITARDKLRRTADMLVERYAHSDNWKTRQMYVLLCYELLKENAWTPEVFAEDALPYLMELSWDVIPNVRLVVARLMSRLVWTNSYFSSPDSKHYDSLESVLRRLQADKDEDVRDLAMVDFEKDK